MCPICWQTEEETTHLHYVDPYSIPQKNPALCASSGEIIHYLVRSVVGHLKVVLYYIVFCYFFFGLVQFMTDPTDFNSFATVLRQISTDCINYK